LDAGFNILLGSYDNETMNDKYRPTMLPGKNGMHEQFCKACRAKSGAPASTTVVASPGSSAADQYKLTLSVGGMTCSSCVRTVTDAMNAVDGVNNAMVSLLNSFAACTLARENMADAVRDSIEECGFEVHVVSIESERHSTTVEEPRTVLLKVDGISDPYVTLML